jgi:hypothetical protein
MKPSSDIVAPALTLPMLLTAPRGRRAAERRTRLAAGCRDDPGRGAPERIEVGLVVRAGDDVLGEQHVVPRAVVMGRHAEHRRVRAGLLLDVVGERSAMPGDGHEMRHASPGPVALVGGGDRADGGLGVVGVRKDGCQRWLVGDQRPHVLRVGRDERQRVHRATAAREQVNRSEPDLTDDPMQIIGVLLGCRLGRRVVLDAALRPSRVVGDDRAVGEVAGEGSEARRPHR